MGVGITTDLNDILFLLTQLRLPGNNPLNIAPIGTGTILDPFGIRNTQGIGNNLNNPLWGAADQLFPRLTYNAFTFKRTFQEAVDLAAFTGSPRVPLWTILNAQGQALRGGYTDANGVAQAWGNGGLVNWSYKVGSTFINGAPDPTTGAINPVVSPTPVTIDYAVRGTTITDYRPRFISNTVVDQTAVAPARIIDNPRQNGNVRINPLTGTVNPLAYSGLFTLMGQFFDHGLDFVKKGADGSVLVPILPSDPLYSTAPGARNFFRVSRTNTAPGADPGDALNTVSPYVDLSQDYGSVQSHTLLLKEVVVLPNGTWVPTGNLVSKQGTTGLTGELANWNDLKANALLMGLVMHDYNVEDLPQLQLDANGNPVLNATGQAMFAVVDAAGNAVANVRDTNKATLAANGWTLLTTGHAALDDMAAFALAGTTPPPFPAPLGFTTADLVQTAAGDNPTTYAAAMQAAFNSFAPGQTFYDVGVHYVAGDGRVNENIGLTMIHDVFHKEHNRNVDNLIKDHLMVYNPLTGTYTGPNGTGGTTTWTGEDLFQAAKLITEMEYQHMIFGEFARKLSPNINAFAAYDINIQADISAEFAHSVYRFGHSMLTEFVDRGTYNSLTGTATGTIINDLLLNDFLSPGKYVTKAADGTNTGGEVAIGMTRQVGNAIDEWMTPTLRNNLVGQKLDLAMLNIIRGRDSGVPSWNDTRASLYSQTGMSTLRPYDSWNDVGLNLLNPDITLKNLIMAYARDAILLRYGINPNVVAPAVATLDDWNALELGDTATVKTFANALSAAADAAMADAVFMDTPANGGNADFWNVDLWVGGLAEDKVPGGMLGSTFDAIFATQMLNLQDGDRMYYLSRLAGTNMLLQIEGQLFSDIVMRNTGVKHLYSDAFSVADSNVELATATNFASLLALSNGGPLSGTTRLGTAGFVAGTFYGNPGNYLDASGALNPNGRGNASETLGGTDAPNNINALGGNDTVWGDGGDDTVEGGAGNDFLHGGDGNDLISDLAGDDFIWGDAGNDNINAGSGIDQVFGGLGNDTVAGGLGGDVIDGGDGDDLLYGDNGAVDAVSGNMDPTGDADVIDGGAGNDTIYGGGGNDAITGGDGNDVIDGGMGNNLLSGLAGDDRFLNDPGQLGFNSTFDGGVGFDTVDYSRSSGNLVAGGGRVGINIDLSNAGVAVVPVGANLPDSFLSVEAAIGTIYDDVLSGGLRQPGLGGLNRPTATQTDAAGNPILDALGNEIPMDFSIAGLDGNDWVLGSDGNDTLSGGAGNDTLMGGLANDRFAFTTEVVSGGVDLILDFQALAGNSDWIVLDRTGFNSLNGSTVLSAAEFRSGGGATAAATAAERIIYNSTNGNLYYDSDGLGGAASIQFATLAAVAPAAGQPAVLPSLTAASFVLQGPAPAANLTLTGTALADSLVGATGSDLISGLGGNDTLNGGAGNDTLSGGAGSDAITTGTGIDRVVFDSAPVAGEIDRITDLTITAGDRLVFDRSVFNNLTAGASLTAAEFRTGSGVTAASSATQRVLYNTLNGFLYYDPDGTGSRAAVQIATLLNRPTLTAANLLMRGTTAPVVFAGTPGADVAYGSSANDNLSGSDGNDDLYGYAGNDTLNGGLGVDTLRGGDGSDTFTFNTAIAGGTNVDLVFDFTNATDRLLLDRAVFDGVSSLGTALTAAELLSAAGATAATTAAQRIIHNTTTGEIWYDGDGSGLINAPVAFARLQPGTALTAASIALQGVAPGLLINGTALADNLSGGNGNDTINGLAGNDTISGLGGDDTINGGTGNDSISGGVGNDRFVFDSTLGPLNIDTITDFGNGADSFTLDRAIFGTLSTGATLTAAELISGAGLAAATTAGQRILYNTTNGVLSYDADGSGLTAAPVAFAMLTGSPAITAAQFNLVGVGTGGGGGPTVINGTAGNDNLAGTALNETINGLDGNDTINGGGGNDTLSGGLGADRLTGGVGVDAFRFDSTLGATNVDTIVDFAAGETVQLSRTVFTPTATAGTGFTTVGPLATTQFLEVRSGGAAGFTPLATTATQRILFDRDTGNTWYDPDGTGATAATRFATFTGFRAAAGNFTIVA